MTSTRSCPGWSSAGWKVRPRSASTPIVSKNDADTNRPLTRSGSPSPTTFRSAGRVAERLANERASRR